MVVRSFLSLLTGVFRVILYLIGVGLFALGLWILFFAAGVDRWVPASVLAAGFVLLVGLLVMGAADRAHLD